MLKEVIENYLQKLDLLHPRPVNKLTIVSNS